MKRGGSPESGEDVILNSILMYILPTVSAF